MRTTNERGSAGLMIADAVDAAVMTMSAAAQVTSRVSVSSSGAQANFGSGTSSVSADGRYVAFVSYATNLVPSDGNGTHDVFVRDRQSGQTSRVSVGSGGIQGNDESTGPAISADGRYVAFTSLATNLAPGDANGVSDVFVRDRQSGQTTRVSVDSNGNEGNGGSGNALPSISADGRFVAFDSTASNLVPGDTNAVRDAFVHDRQNGQTTRVSINSSGVAANSGSTWPSISADGRYVAFQSAATNLVTGDTNATSDIFVRDRQSALTVRVSVDSIGLQGNAASQFPAISADGRSVVFVSYASNLVPGDTNAFADVFAHDLQAGQTSRMSVDSAGAEGNGHCVNFAWLSADGRFVAFESYAANLVSSDTNNTVDAFVHDRHSGQTTRVSVDSAGNQGNSFSQIPSISADGRIVAFMSGATNLVAGDTNNDDDVFVRDATHACFVDADQDGSGDPQSVVYFYGGCGAGTVSNAQDCDDTNASIHPGAPEVCNGLDDDCDGSIDEDFVHSYCTASSTTNGCVSVMSSSGVPSASATSGFVLTAASMDGQRTGLIFYGISGPVSTTWGSNGHFLCVKAPTQRTGTQNSGGTAGACDGAISLDMTAYRAANPLSLGTPILVGSIEDAQCWFHDPVSSKTTAMTDGIEYTWCP